MSVTLAFFNEVWFFSITEITETCHSSDMLIILFYLILFSCKRGVDVTFSEKKLILQRNL